jgi:hypothetical protein
MSSLAIQLDNVTKKYRTGRSRTLVDLVASNLDRLRGKNDDVHSAARGRISRRSALRDVDDIRRRGLASSAGTAPKTTPLKPTSRVTRRRAEWCASADTSCR